jgi:hypothetical protein
MKATYRVLRTPPLIAVALLAGACEREAPIEPPQVPRPRSTLSRSSTKWLAKANQRWCLCTAGAATASSGRHTSPRIACGAWAVSCATSTPKGENRPLHASVVLIAGVGHFVAQEKPAEFNHVLEEIVRDLRHAEAQSATDNRSTRLLSTSPH